ncbi:MAG: beta-galactosidase [Halanaerobiales bacterium]
MTKKYNPINEKYPHFLHGGDYNPDQWLNYPQVLKEDIELMKKAHCNTMSVGIFAWAALEPEEGEFNFDWMDEVLDRLADNGLYAVLATPSGARPAWMAQKYPEVLRVKADRQRILFSGRHNHCYTSPVYREKVRIINTKLAERYKDHPAVLLWHLSNEYGGECHCELCQQAFREWLKNKYGTLENLNQAWWSMFWSHTYTDWSQIESPAPHGMNSIHGLVLDWKRFVTHQTVDFMKNEIKPLKDITPDIPVTTNMMGTYPVLDYWKFAEELDVISWDNYPRWHGKQEDWKLASDIGFVHDINRSLKGGQPFMLMESTPSMTNWMSVSKLKRPGMHLLSSLQAVAHGADTVQYFQWRKGRGGFEKFHGAVVDHVGHENTRVFRDVKKVGQVLEKLDPVIGTSVEPEVAIIYDWENRWAINEAMGPRQKGKNYEETCKKHYRELWKRGIAADIINEECDLSRYKLVIAPMLYMIRDNLDERIREFVNNGGTFVTTYWSGIVDEHDLCFRGGYPGPIRDVMGIWVEEIDALYKDDKNYVVPEDGNNLKMKQEYEAGIFCSLLHAEDADILATYKSDFYAGRPALTVNKFGDGQAYYIASRNEDVFLNDFYCSLISDLDIEQALNIDIPEGVTVQKRTDGNKDYIFILNFTDLKKNLDLSGIDKHYINMLNGKKVNDEIKLSSYGITIIKG